MILGLRRTKEDLQQGTIEKYWNVNYEGNALGTNYPIFSEDVTGFIILDYFNHNENSFMKIDNLQATIIDEFGDEDDIFDDRESLSEKYDQYKPWKYADRLFLLVACANYIAKKLDVKEINIRKEDDADYGIYKRAYEFLNRDIKTEIQTKLR